MWDLFVFMLGWEQSTVLACKDKTALVQHWYAPAHTPPTNLTIRFGRSPSASRSYIIAPQPERSTTTKIQFVP